MEDEPTLASYFLNKNPSAQPPKSSTQPSAAVPSWDARVTAAVTEVTAALLWPGAGIDQITELVLQCAKALTDSADGFISLLDPATGDDEGHGKRRDLECAVDRRVRSARLTQDADGLYPGLWGIALNTREGHFINRPAQSEHSRGVPAGHALIEAFLAAPAVVGTEVFGQIALANPAAPYTEKELQAVQRLADLLALALERFRLREALAQR